MIRLHLTYYTLTHACTKNVNEHFLHYRLTYFLQANRVPHTLTLIQPRSTHKGSCD